VRARRRGARHPMAGDRQRAGRLMPAAEEHVAPVLLLPFRFSVTK
jgi:hypothetical protein